jgi:hypothetical protein
MGFVLDPSEAKELIERNPRNRDVLFPYINGHDLNSTPDQTASRWVINFRDWPLERAEQYPECLAIVRERVKPERDRNPNKQRRELWWRFTRPTVDLYEAITNLERVLVLAQVSNTVAPAFVYSKMVYSHKLIVFPYDDDARFGLLTSALHRVWAVRYSSTMRADVSYAPSDCFETFPQPVLVNGVIDAGNALDQHRREVMLNRKEGLTTIYNRVNDPDEHSNDIAILRDFHVELDHVIAAAYGWEDLDLDHDFRETRQGLRYTFDPTTVTEVLDRLLELNHARYADEVRRGLHDRKSGTKKQRAKGQASFDGL